MTSAMRSRETAPMGTLMKKIQCQDQLSVIHPPSSGPMMGPNMTPTPKIDMASPCWAGGKVSSRMDWEIGCSAPPAMPWKTRNTVTVMISMPYAIHHGIPHIEVARCHVDLRPQRACTVRKLAAAHPVEQ